MDGAWIQSSRSRDKCSSERCSELRLLNLGGIKKLVHHERSLEPTVYYFRLEQLHWTCTQSRFLLGVLDCTNKHVRS